MTDSLHPLSSGNGNGNGNGNGHGHGHESAAALIGKSACIRAFHQALPCVARAELNVLLCGEPGTGKRHWAQVIHEQSSRQSRPFLTVRVVGHDEATTEARLFGGKDGVLARAQGGTVYLDGVEALTSRLQQRLVHWFEFNAIDVRIISGTASTLPEDMRFGRFAPTLYGRLAVLQLTVAPLRERPEDIPAIVEHCLCHARLAHPTPVVRDDALAELCRYTWPENTRELVQIVDAARAAANGRPITADLIRGVLGRRPRRNSAIEILPLDQIESEYIHMALARCDGNQSMAARRLGIGRSTLIRKLRASGLRTPRAA